MKMIKGIFYTICCLCSLVGNCQLPELNFNQTIFGKVIDEFTSEVVTVYYDSLQIPSNDLGVISINFYNQAKSLFPVLYLGSTHTQDDEYCLIEIAMIFRQEFFDIYNPTYFSNYKGRLITIFTGLELMLSSKDYNFFKKRINKFLYPAQSRMFIWLVKINQSNNTFEVVEKRVLF